MVCVLAQVVEGAQGCPLRDPRQLDQVMGASGRAGQWQLAKGLVTGDPGPSASLARTWASGCTRVWAGHPSAVQERIGRKETLVGRRERP